MKFFFPLVTVWTCFQIPSFMGLKLTLQQIAYFFLHFGQGDLEIWMSPFSSSSKMTMKTSETVQSQIRDVFIQAWWSEEKHSGKRHSGIWIWRNDREAWTRTLSNGVWKKWTERTHTANTSSVLTDEIILDFKANFPKEERISKFWEKEIFSRLFFFILVRIVQIGLLFFNLWQ